MICQIMQNDTNRDLKVLPAMRYLWNNLVRLHDHRKLFATQLHGCFTPETGRVPIYLLYVTGFQNTSEHGTTQALKKYYFLSLLNNV